MERAITFEDISYFTDITKDDNGHVYELSQVVKFLKTKDAALMSEDGKLTTQVCLTEEELIEYINNLLMFYNVHKYRHNPVATLLERPSDSED